MEVHVYNHKKALMSGSRGGHRWGGLAGGVVSREVASRRVSVSEVWSLHRLLGDRAAFESRGFAVSRRARQRVVIGEVPWDNVTVRLIGSFPPSFREIDPISGGRKRNDRVGEDVFIRRHRVDRGVSFTEPHVGGFIQHVGY